MNNVQLEGEAYLKSAEDVLRALRTTEHQGLSKIEVTKRRARYGLNHIPKEKNFRLLKLFLHRFQDVLVVILLLAGAISLLLGRIEDALIIGIAIAIDAGLSFAQVWRTEKTLERLREQVADTVTVLRGGETQTIPADQLVPGDVIETRSGERIPADARLLKVDALRVQEAILTGESSDVKKDPVRLETKTTVGNRANMLFAGTDVVAGSGTAVVTSIGLRTEFGKIAQVLKGQPSPPSPLRRKLQRQGLVIGWVIIGAVFLLAVIGLLQGSSLSETARTAITLIVSAIPEDLTMILTIALTVGVVRILRQKGVVRELSSGETLGAATVICTDKTGTLTQGKMKATSLNFLQGDVLLPEESLPDDHIQLSALHALALCTSAHRKPGHENEYFGSSTERTALAFVEGFGLNQTELRRQWKTRDTIPFSTEWKYRMMMFDHPTQPTQQIFIAGAPEVLLEKSSYALNEEGEIVELTSEHRAAIHKKIDDLATKGFRLLGVGMKRHVEQSEITHDDVKQIEFLGILTIQDPVRREVRDSIKQTHSAGVAVKLVTGDYEKTARAVAREVGLTATEDQMLSGEELRGMNDAELINTIDDIVIFSRVEPLDKQRIIRALQSKGHVVAMTGDGVNDAVALKSADIGVAMGSGADIAKDSADLVLLDDSFSTIVAAIKEGRIIRDNVRKVILFLLSTNAAEVAIFFVSILLGLPLPLLPAQILWINLVTDGTSDIALSLEPAEREVMNRNPEDPKASLINKTLYGHLLFSGLVFTVVTMAMFWYLLHERQVELAYAQTMAFTFLAVSSLISVWSFRSLSEPILKRGFFQNKWVIFSAGGSFLLHLVAIYTPGFQSFFGTVPLHAKEWAYIIGMSIVTTIIIDLRKRFLKEPNHRLRYEASS